MAHFSKALAIALMAVFLAGCPDGAGITCMTLKKYSADFQGKAEAEYAMIEKQAPHITQMIDDYGVNRDAIRECLARQKKARK